MMKRHFIVSLIVLSISAVNLFSLNSFIQQQKSHQHKFCPILAHIHHHLHHGVEHTHGHSHKVNLVDFYSEQADNIDKTIYVNNEYYEYHASYKKIIPAGLFRPPIS
jgi:hypothetical protein